MKHLPVLTLNTMTGSIPVPFVTQGKLFVKFHITKQNFEKQEATKKATKLKKAKTTTL